ncbi:hypothetical protein [Halohasta litorea]|uniref:Uncharacterized protein n=1 Tax=Halohasta litorea TaxID=869891 RepID=A0ABD6DEA3_9EURY|nr:hypothetical protein [Halohasta litorea]
MHLDHTYNHERGLADYYHRICDEIDILIVIYKRDLTVPRSVLVDLSERKEEVAVKVTVDNVVEFSRPVENAFDELT